MIYEYALEPSLVVDWALARAGRWVMSFGLDQRRLVSDFPREWKSRVVGMFYERFEYDDSTAEFQSVQPIVDAYLQVLTDRMVGRDIALPSEIDWLKEAIKEHAVRPFYAILAARRPEVCPAELILQGDCDDIRDARWHLPTVSVIRKSAREIAQSLKPMLRGARNVCIVDPYFDPKEKRFRDTLIEIVACALEVPKAVQATPLITLVTSVEREFTPYEQRTLTAEANVAANMLKMARKHILPLLPPDFPIRLVVLKNIPGGDPVHNRFVLTDVGGVILPYGIDNYDREQNHGAKDDIAPMQRGMFNDRSKQYVDLRGVGIVLGPVSI